jgi:hypothetical protein
MWDRDHGGAVISETTHVLRTTQTLVITTDGEKYNRQRLYPIKGGRYSSKSLRSAHDPEVLAVRARDHLRGVARLAENLSRLDRRTAEDYVGALAQVVAKADESRKAVIDLMRAATAGGES